VDITFIPVNGVDRKTYERLGVSELAKEFARQVGGKKLPAATAAEALVQAMSRIMKFHWQQMSWQDLEQYVEPLFKEICAIGNPAELLEQYRASAAKTCYDVELKMHGSTIASERFLH
jgi:hypothetical protein